MEKPFWSVCKGKGNEMIGNEWKEMITKLAVS